MGTEICVNIAPCNGLLPDCTKPLPELMLTTHQRGLCHSHRYKCPTKCSIYLSLSLKIINLRLNSHLSKANELTHWGRVTHICIDKLTIISSDNGLSPGRRQAIIWTNAGILLIRTLRKNLVKSDVKFIYFYAKNTFEIIVFAIEVFLSRYQCVKGYGAPFHYAKTPGARRIGSWKHNFAYSRLSDIWE